MYYHVLCQSGHFDLFRTDVPLPPDATAYRNEMAGIETVFQQALTEKLHNKASPAYKQDMQQWAEQELKPYMGRYERLAYFVRKRYREDSAEPFTSFHWRDLRPSDAATIHRNFCSVTEALVFLLENGYRVTGKLREML